MLNNSVVNSFDGQDGLMDIRYMAWRKEEA
jgi:hypothetical protein